MEILHVIIIGAAIAIAACGLFKVAFKYGYEIYKQHAENKEKKRRADICSALERDKQNRVSSIVKRLYENNDYLMSLVMHRRALPRFNKRDKLSKHSPTKFIDDHLNDMIQDQIRRSMTTAEHTHFHEVCRRIAD